jgi:hypothetical protein
LNIEQQLNESLLKLSGKQKDKFKSDFNKAFDNLKKKHKAGKLMPSDFTQVVHALYRIPPEHIVDETYSVFQVVRFAVSVGVPFLIHPALGLIGWLVNRTIEEKVNEKYEGTVVKKYRNELASIEEKLKDPKTPESEKEDLQNAKRYYKDGIDKLERYFESIKSYKHEVPVEPTNDDDDDDFGFSFDESTSLVNGGVQMIYNDEQMAKVMIKQYNESLDQIISLCLESGGFPELNEGARQIARSAHSKVERMDRKSSRAIDSVADPVIDGDKKTEVKKIRQDILEGRLKVSTILKRGFTYALVHFTFGPQAAFVSAAIWLARKGWLKKRQKEEMLAELKSELEIINEKIKDAESDNDKKKKYQYIRLRREIQRNIDRIRFNDTLKNMDHGVY